MYRNGDDTKESVTIGSDESMDAYNRFTNYSKTLKDVERKKSNIEKEYKEVKKTLKSWADGLENRSEERRVGKEG